MKFKYLSILLLLGISSGLWANEVLELRSVQDRVACMAYIAKELPNCITSKIDANYLASIQADLNALKERFEIIVKAFDSKVFQHESFFKFQKSIEEFCDSCALIHKRIQDCSTVKPRHVRLLSKKASNIEAKFELVNGEDSSGQALLSVGADYYVLKKALSDWANDFGCATAKVVPLTGSVSDQVVDTLFFRLGSWLWGKKYTIAVTTVTVGVAAAIYARHSYHTHRKAQSLEGEALGPDPFSLMHELPLVQTNGKQKVLAGLANPGAICYANSVHKLLSVHPDINDLLTPIEGECLLTDVRALSSDQEEQLKKNWLRWNLRKLISKMHDSKKANIIGYEEFSKPVFKMANKLFGDDEGPWAFPDRQQDAYEYLPQLLNALDAGRREAFMVESFSRIELQDEGELNRNSIYTDDRYYIEDNNKAWRKREEASTYVSTSVENNVDPDSAIKKDLIDILKIVETMSKENGNEVMCPDSVKRNAKRTLNNFVKVPKALIICLNRTGYTGACCYKFKDKVNATKDLKLVECDFKEKEERQVYLSLKAAVVHAYGGADGGHYVCYIKDQGSWWRHSDTTVEKVEKKLAEPEINTKGTVFLYVRK